MTAERATPEQNARFRAAMENASRFFVRDADVWRAMRKLAEALDEAHIPYAVAGAMALNLHGYERVTKDVDVVLTRESLAAMKTALLGRGYLEKFPGSKAIRDTIHNVAIDILIAGDFPGDGKPKPVRFPDPAAGFVETKDAVRVLPLARVLEMKLASGMTAPHRLKDLADVVEVVRALKLPRETAASLDEFVRGKFDELWVAAQGEDPFGD